MTATALPASTTATGYFESTRSPRYSILFALPLLIAYEALAALLSSPNGGMRNGADVMFKNIFTALGGGHGPAVVMAVVILIGMYFVRRDLKRSRQPLNNSYFIGMFAESTLLAIGFGVVIGTVTAKLLGAAHLLAIAAPQDVAHMSWGVRLMLSLGAGLYEELFFRVVMVSGLAVLCRVGFGFSRGSSTAIAVIVSAVVFSIFHYVGAYGDAFQLSSFTFRLLSGLAFSGLYVTRGFGVTAWTHALYDAFLLLF